jgi:putative ABC transport system permease protein
VVYTANQRTKEIGVRKVLGASVQQIVMLLSKEFLLLVIVAFIIAAPVAWLLMHQWLQNFADRTAINWWIFGLSGSVMFITALIILSFKTVQAATCNPVKSLRTE